MPIIETEIWKPSPGKPGMVTFDKHRPAKEIFAELEAHLKADGRMPDEYFLLARKWGEKGAMFPRDADVISSVNFGGSEGIYIDISLRYEKDVHEFNKAAGIVETDRRYVTETFATGKTLGETIEDLDRMNLVASSVTAAFFGDGREVMERYALIESGELEPQYPRPSFGERQLKEQTAAKEPPQTQDAARANETAEPYTRSETMKTLAEYHPQCDNPKFIDLMERMDKNFSDYRNEMEKLGASELISKADEIAATTDVFHYLATHHSFEEDELDFYLLFENPLEIICDEWYRRRCEIDDMSFAMSYIDSRRDDKLVDYPLINGKDAPADLTSPRRYMDVDLEQKLGQIAEKVIVHDTFNWETDMQAIRKAALSGSDEEKRLFWQVCGQGSRLAVERDMFIKGTSAFYSTTGYRPDDPSKLGFALEINGTDERGAVRGNVYEVGDCNDFIKRVRETAEPMESVTLFYSDGWGVNAGKTVHVSRHDYEATNYNLLNACGNVAEKVYLPQDKLRLAGLIAKARSDQMKLPMGNVDALLQRVSEKHAETFGASEISEKAAENQMRITDVQMQAADRQNQTPPDKQPPKPKTLAGKLQAANEKAKSQGGQANAKKPQKREGRD